MTATTNPEPQADKICIYRHIEGVDLHMHRFLPSANNCSGCGLVFFHGGGWTSGSPEGVYPVAAALQRAGHAVYLAQYRLTSAHPVSLWDLVGDAHAALTWAMEDAATLGIPRNRFGAGGGSAGGHLALSTALIPAPGPHPSAPKPAFLLLANPVIDTSTEGYGNTVCGDDWERLSPLHASLSSVPPTAIFHGTADRITPIAGARAFRDKARQLGRVCELHEFPDRGHGFFRSEPDLSMVTNGADTFIRLLFT